MGTNTQFQMHRDHQQWQSENDFWHDQIREWQQQTTCAIGDLKSICDAFADHQQSLERHAAAVRLYGLRSAEHEHELATTARLDPNQLAACSDETCCGDECDHAQVRLRHETLKRHHHTLMARVEQFLSSLRSQT